MKNIIKLQFSQCENIDLTNVLVKKKNSLNIQINLQFLQPLF